jgi:antirestriction protein ArdC
MASQDHGYMSRHWMTFRQAEELKAHVRKNEHGSMVVYADRMTRTEHLATGEDVERQVPFLKSYIVFNAEQIAGLPEHYYAKPGPKPAEPERIQRVEDFFAATKAEIRHGGVRAFYSPKHDFINMPSLEKFWNAEAYYGTLAHETIHWTKGTGRIERETAKSWGDEKYAYEEIVAELGASYICADLDITPKVPEQDENASYIQSWLKVLKGNNHAIFSAAAKAQTAADFLHKLQAREPGLENTARNNYDPVQPPALTNG